MPCDISALGVHSGWVTGRYSDHGSLWGGCYADSVCGIARTRNWRILAADGIRKLDRAFLHLVGEIFGLAEGEGYDRERGVFAAAAGELAAVGDEEIVHVVRLPVFVNDA